MNASNHPTDARTVQRVGDAYRGSPPENYQQYLVPAIAEPLASLFIQRAALREGERVLDVACGTGVLTRYAAERVGAAGSVSTDTQRKAVELEVVAGWQPFVEDGETSYRQDIIEAAGRKP